MVSKQEASKQSRQLVLTSYYPYNSLSRMIGKNE
jgi:hypothetical protein